MLHFDTIRTRSSNGVLFATIDAPPLNLIGPGFAGDLAKLVRFLEEDQDHRVVVFDSANPDFFLAHIDVAHVGETRTAIQAEIGDPSTPLLFHRLASLPVVTIAVVTGRVRGAGSEFALACDLLYAGDHAIFGQPEAGIGLYPGGGAVPQLSRLMGRTRAMEVLLTGDDYPAALAERFGWVTRMLPEAEVGAFAAAQAERIASFPRDALLTIKRQVGALTQPDVDMIRGEGALFAQSAGTPAAGSRLKQLYAMGFEKPGEVELDMGRVLPNLHD